MIVDHKIELETKILKDYPEWQFLSSSELKRKTIQIYFDLKIAKDFVIRNKRLSKFLIQMFLRLQLKYFSGNYKNS